MSSVEFAEEEFWWLFSGLITVLFRSVSKGFYLKLKLQASTIFILRYTPNVYSIE